MSTRVRPHRLWAVATGVALVVSLGLVQAPSAAAADSSSKYCTINISTGYTFCSSVDPDKAGRLARPAADGSGSVILGRFYDDIDRDGTDGFTTVSAASGCDTSPDLDFTLGTMPSGWNDRISSFQGFNNCSVRLWKNGGATGTYWGPATYADTLSTMDNQASSLTFY